MFNSTIDWLNPLERIPKQIEQYQTENAKLEKDLPTLREIVGGTWKKEDELKELKSEVAALERKIQLALTPPEQSNKGLIEESQKEITPLNTFNHKFEIPKNVVVLKSNQYSKHKM